MDSFSEFQEEILKDSNAFYERVVLRREIEQIYCHDKVKHC